jgi:hypothetical protein
MSPWWEDAVINEYPEIQIEIIVGSQEYLGGREVSEGLALPCLDSNRPP